MPFKFNPSWALEEDFKQFVLNNWKVFDSSLGSYVANEVIQNLKVVKPLVVDWARKGLANRG